MDVITSHLNSDFDALASMVAAKKYYPEAVIVFPGSQEKTVRDFLETMHPGLDTRKIREIDIQKVTRLILVDTKKPGRIGRFSEILGKKGLSIHIYDHHPFSDNDIRGQVEVVEAVGSTTTIFTEMIQKDRTYISPEEATIMMLGIYEETGSLLFPSTTTRELTAAAYLLKKGANLKIVSSFISKEMDADEIDLLNELVHSAKDHLIHDITIKIAMASRDKYIGDIAFLAHKIREIDDVDVVILLVTMEGKVRVIARSHTPEVDVAEILKPLGGGGHASAASANLKDMPLEEAETALMEELKKKIHPSKTAKDIMTSPVKSIPWNHTVKTAEKTMTRYEVNALPVLKNKHLYGLISREAVEKALFHGFGRTRVSEFCTTDVPSVTPSTPISRVESMMIEQNQRFLPVVEKGMITGAITRTDLLRSLYESLLRKSRVNTRESITAKASMGKNMSSGMRTAFPREVFDLLKLSGKIADELGYSAYLVGGSVRDILRGETNLDIDIVIEGDGIRFAQQLAKKLGLRVKCHKRFGTAVVITEFLKFDVATARTEYYESPAALPTVETSSIKKDLYRRDFTINTLAIKLNPGNFGQLIDFFGGQRDIKEKTIRILHNLSFIEDPTRAFRAIRFSERFGFKISKHTLKLIKTAVRIKLFEKLSGTRMYDELSLIFAETEPVKTLKRLSKLDLMKFIHPNLEFTRDLEETFISIEETFSWFKLLFFEEDVNKSHLFLMAILDELADSEKTEALQRLNVPKGAGKELLEGIKGAKGALRKLRNADQKDIYHTLMPLDLHTILFAMAKAKQKDRKQAVSLYLTKLRNIRPELTGTDLQSMGYRPGPLFKTILNAVLDARLERTVKSREEEIRFVKEHFPVK